MNKQHILIHKWADNWQVLNSPTPDFEEVTLQDLIEAHDFD